MEVATAKVIWVKAITGNTSFGTSPRPFFSKDRESIFG